ncbi:SprA-related family protein [Allochromatium warmingii]|uniref:SprA-related family protein n=1 Tax=Allochromatium warmingii TaxID=61595 RepID=A0A1H3E4T0_ALLWA|nr:putative metalloprotease CJM1_0395 family protein [Allochromatium warmingii]SDX73258.1 SprA-related family protein [Allochromatium warmingii]
MEIHSLTPYAAGLRSMRVEARDVPPPGLQEPPTATPPASGTENPRAVTESAATETPDTTRDDDPTTATATDVTGEPLTLDEQSLLEQLKQRDTEVRAHEQAHMAAGGGYITSGASYSYQTGPDGRRYAIGGEVGIDTAMNADDPEGNLIKARAIIRAALAPAEPSSQDVRVAASAREMEIIAQQDIRSRQVKLYETVMENAARGTAETEANPHRNTEPETRPAISAGQARLTRPLTQLAQTSGVNRWA